MCPSGTSFLTWDVRGPNGPGNPGNHWKGWSSGGVAAANRSDGDRRLADAELGRAGRPSRPAAFPAVELGGVRPGGPVEVAIPGPRQRPGEPPPAEPGQPPLLTDGT